MADVGSKVLYWVRLIPTQLYNGVGPSVKDGYGGGVYPYHGDGFPHGNLDGNGTGTGKIHPRWNPNGEGGGPYYGGRGL